MAKRIFGLSAALVSPFDASGAPDLPRLARHAEWVIANGCDSLTLFGTTGEGFSIGLAERAAMLGAVLAGGMDPAERLYAAVADSTMDGAAAQARLALEHGARGLLFTPPFYFKNVPDDGLFAWFARTFDKIGPDLRGVILYHIPGQTAAPLSVALISRLRAAFPQAIAGIKDSSGDWANAEACLAAHGDLSVLVGDERLLARAMKAGAEGSICGLANFAPGMLRAVIHDGRDDPRVGAAVERIVARPVLPAIKALVAHRHGDPAYARMRPPLTDLDAAEARALADEMDAILAETAPA